MSRRAHGPLFWRVYLHGVLLLLVVAVAVAGVGFALRRGSGWWSQRGAGRYAAERVGELAGDPPRLAAELERAREAFGVEASVYGPGGGLVATSVRDPAAAARADGRRRGWTVPLRGGGTLVVHSPPHDPARGLLFIGAVLAALAVASYPLTRAIVAPVERLTAAARALGAGDLAARANVRAHGELGELGRSFDEMAARLEALVRGERELLANVSHELRTPLARIRVALELAAEGDAARARRYLGEIGQDLAELDALIEDVLDAARLEARGAAALRNEGHPVDLAAVAEEAAERFRGAHEGRALELDAGSGLPLLRGDAVLLRRLLDNLLDNAAKYSEPPAPVRLSVRAEPDAAVVEVTDRGIGIPAEDLPRLFTPFFRTDRSRERGTGGTGLGLVLARRIAEAHGGSISVESAPGQGSTFRVRLPAPRE
ncbi:HAMP domain-containing sensor histidine kinase [Anaeromyxobacter dehalogenans]|uniref:histidine kinase n=1 Tax=Anaeromyxobacter dehalogenans (strain 2CP-C) TaxID=290397 RepID=Q2IDM7_ANADE|nr:HAMP domain-containing sensor histidine kinase [Anaeromyxobacter dehalogenans]ABC82685.1 periplasmic sensor signal transduction histidine kinase [Anaeromyxobacter dehalogenans 2CP-C]